MSGSPAGKIDVSSLSPNHFGPGNLWLFFGVLFFFAGMWEVVGQAPNYTHDPLESKNLDYFTVTTADAFNVEAKTSRLIIAVDTDPDGVPYVLTFGNGIKKIGVNGGLIDFIPNQSNRLSNVMDFAINSEGKFFVATNESNRRFIRVYSSAGVYLPDETLGDGTYGNGPNKFRGPTGLTFDKNDNLFVADHYIGTANPPPTNPSFIKIYRKDALGNYKNNLIKEFDKIQGTLLNFPYRLAVNSLGHLYMAELGQNGNASVKIIQFDANFNPTQVGEISDTSSPIGSPGSLIIDKFDNIFIADFGDDLNLTNVLEATGDIDAFLEVFEVIRDGIKQNVFNINIYNPDNSFKFKITSEIDFVVDLAISNCGTLFVNNAIFDGKIDRICLFGTCYQVPDISVDFDLEVYKRSSGYDTEAPEITNCPADIEVTAAVGETSSVVNYSAPNPTDNCSTPVLTRDGPASGSNFPIGATTITYTAKDEAGNIETCSFKITVNSAEEEEDTEDPKITCPENITQNADTNICGAVVNYTIPIATDNVGTPTVSRTAGFAPGEVFPVGTTVVTYQARDAAGNTADCSFSVTITDNIFPTITCTASITEIVPFGRSGKIINYNPPVFSDNCTNPTISQTAGLSSGSVFPLGTTTNTFVVTDASENTASCSFTVTLTEGADTEKPKITCPSNITQNVDSNNCGAVVTYPLPTAIDNSGNASVRLKSGIATGEIFPVGATTVTYEATDAAGNKDECSFTVTVIDHIPPSIFCPDNIGVKVDSGQDYAVVTFPNATTTDNCSATVLQTQGSPSGSQFPQGIHTIEFTATDVSGNKTTCAFTITVSGEDQPEPPVFKDCPSNIARGTDVDECGAIVNFPTPTASDSDGAVSVNLTSTLGPGDFFPVGTTIVTFEASGSDSTVVECRIEVVVRDTQKPQFTNPCQGIIYTAGFEITEGFEVPDFSDDFGPYDNCDTNLEIIQVPAPGTLIYSEGTHPVTLTIKDQAGNSNTCTFEMSITARDSFDLICNSTIRLPANNECEFILPDLSEEYNVYPPSAVVTQSIDAGELLTEDTEVVITATYNGEVRTCVIMVNLVDYSWPEITCLPSQNVPFTPSEGFVIPNYVDEVVATDNCEVVSVIQNIQPGTIIREDSIVTITATDNFGNTKDCFVYIYLKAEEDTLDISCPEDQFGQLNEQCQFSIPDYTGSANVNLAGATISQSPAPGNMVSENTVITLTASLGQQTDSCTFNLTLNSASPPVITCPVTQTEFFNPEDGFVLLDYRNLAEVTGDCGIASITQTPSPGTIIYENTPVQLVVTSTSNLVSHCEFMVNLSEEEVLEISCIEDQEEEINENCEVVVPDYTSLSSVNFENATVTQSPIPGSIVSENTTILLTATLNGETDVCSFLLTTKDSTPPVAVCITGFELQLNENGTAPLNAADFGAQSSDNCEIVSMSLDKTTFTTADIGENTVILTVTDSSGNTDSCQALVNVLAYDGGATNFTCRTEVTLILDSTGNAILEASNLYTGDADDRTFSLSKENFNCANLGNNDVTLSWTGSEGPGSCVIKVLVKDETPPVVRTRNISMFLSPTGVVQLSAFLFDDGSSDNCGPVTFSIDKTSLTCKDLGDNTITLTVTDSSGNVTTGTAIVSLTGNCEDPEEPGEDKYEYIYIYPNPTTGPITFWTPANTIIEKVEVFDQRGRLIMRQQFPESVLRYQMDLSGLQQAVYILHVFTSDGNSIIRVIIK